MDHIKDSSWLDDFNTGHHRAKYDSFLQFADENKFNIGILLVLLVIIFQQFSSLRAKADAAGANRSFLEADGFPEIEPLDKFNWEDEEPIKLRLFKPKYFMTMAIENLKPSELLVQDRTYKARIEYRKKIIHESSDICVGVNDDERIRSAVVELYTYLLGHYLPKRFPTMFKLHFAAFETGQQFMFENLITKQMFPTKPAANTTTRMLLNTLGQTVDTDFLFLLPENDSDDPKYKLEAYICICPSGWDPRAKLGKRLASIHAPVPGYKEKLEGSMDRYFKSLEAGKYVKRSNWSITQHEELFMPDPDTNHGYAEKEEAALAEIDPDQVFLRCERQTLQRLPQSKAIVFAFKTYMDSMRDVKLEGLGDDLTAAVDGLTAGNAPGINVYKRAPVWGEAVKDFLRS